MLNKAALSINICSHYSLTFPIIHKKNVRSYRQSSHKQLLSAEAEVVFVQ